MCDIKEKKNAHTHFNVYYMILKCDMMPTLCRKFACCYLFVVVTQKWGNNELTNRNAVFTLENLSMSRTSYWLCRWNFIFFSLFFITFLFIYFIAGMLLLLLFLVLLLLMMIWLRKILDFIWSNGKQDWHLRWNKHLFLVIFASS